MNLFKIVRLGFSTEFLGCFLVRANVLQFNRVVLHSNNGQSVLNGKIFAYSFVFGTPINAIASHFPFTVAASYLQTFTTLPLISLRLRLCGVYASGLVQMLCAAVHQILYQKVENYLRRISSKRICQMYMHLFKCIFSTANTPTVWCCVGRAVTIQFVYLRLFRFDNGAIRVPEKCSRILFKLKLNFHKL